MVVTVAGASRRVTVAGSPHAVGAGPGLGEAALGTLLMLVVSNASAVRAELV